MTSQVEPATGAAGPPGLYAREIVGYDQARWALSAPCLAKDPRLAWEALGYPCPRALGGGEGWVLNLTNTDPPDHTRLRRLLAGALTPARMASMASRIVGAASIVAERMQGAGEVDLIASFIVPLQTMVTGELLGIPPSHRGRFGSLAAGMLAPSDGVGRPGRCDEAYRRMGMLIAEVLVARRARMHPAASPDLQPDLLGALVAVRAGSDRLSVQETESMAMLMISAGQEPTIDLIANGMLALLSHPDQLALFRQSPKLRPRAVEELLRHEAPVRCAVRIAAEDVDLDGTVAVSGSVIGVMLDRAHRDPTRFARPDSLDITREHNPHLTFGHGIHYCIGAPLARLQARIALTELVCRFPRVALADRPERLRWRASRDRHSLVRLPVSLGPSEARTAAGP
jgi:cytochrome P450